MHFSVLSTVAGVLSLPLLVSSSPVAGPKGISIPITRRVSESGPVADIVLRAHLAHLHGKYTHTLENFKKNTGTDHPLGAAFNASSHLTKRATGSDSLTKDSTVVWYGNVDVGTPPVTFKIHFDTASSDFFVPSRRCSSCGSHTMYDPSASSTVSELSSAFSVVYDATFLSLGLTFEASGQQCTETVSIAGLTATQQTMGAATEYNSLLQDSPADGLMGFAFPTLSSYPATPFFNTLINQGTVSAGQFALKLASSGSSLFLGGADPTLYMGSINWNPVTHQGYWQIALDGLTIDGVQLARSAPCIIDSGTRYIIGSVSDVAAIYSHIPGSAQVSPLQYKYPCSSNPSVSLIFGGISYPILSSVFNVGQVSAGSEDCYGAIIAGNNASLPFWVIGDRFMQGVYTVFDFDQSRVGFARLAMPQPSETQTSSPSRRNV